MSWDLSPLPHHLKSKAYMAWLGCDLEKFTETLLSWSRVEFQANPSYIARLSKYQNQNVETEQWFLTFTPRQGPITFDSESGVDPDGPVGSLASENCLRQSCSPLLVVSASEHLADVLRLCILLVQEKYFLTNWSSLRQH